MPNVNPAGDLEGTLNQPEAPNQFDTFRTLMEGMTRKKVEEGPGVKGIISDFKTKIQGKGATTPGVAQGIIGEETKRRVTNVSDIFRSTMRTIDTMEQNKKEQQVNANNLLGGLAEAGILGSLSGEEINIVRQTGSLTPEALQKINQAVITKQAEESVKQPSILEQIAAEKAGGRIEEGRFVTSKAGVDPITGAATDPTKVIQGYDFTSYATDKNWGKGVSTHLANMPTFTSPEDVDAYIQGISPGSPLKAVDIQEVALANGIAPELMLAIMQQETGLMSTDPTRGGVGARGNNPANIGNTDSLVERGGSFGFPTIKDGIQALANNIMRRKVEVGLPEEEEITFPTEEDLGTMSNDARNFVTKVMRQLPTKLKDSEAEKTERQKEALFDFKQGRTIQETVDEIKGFIITNEEERDLAESLRALSTGTDLDLSEISAAINLGNPEKAMTIVENANLEKSDSNFNNLVLTQTVIKRSQEALELLDELPAEFVGIFDRKVNKWIANIPDKASNEDRQKANRIAAILTDINKGIRLEFLGSAMTKAETVLLEDFLTDLADQPATIRTKLDELQNSVLSSHNSARNIVDLPQINSTQLLDNEARLDLYRGVDEAETINIQGQEYNVGQIVTNDRGDKGEIQADGTIKLLERDTNIIDPYENNQQQVEIINE